MRRDEGIPPYSQQDINVLFLINPPSFSCENATSFSKKVNENRNTFFSLMFQQLYLQSKAPSELTEGAFFIGFGNHRLCRWRLPPSKALALSIERSEQLVNKIKVSTSLK